ncbi:MAG: ABC transporter permease [Bdellovibrionales bacterium]|nr:ABC transporter permease [Bdellovibrionales bacterium]
MITEKHKSIVSSVVFIALLMTLLMNFLDYEIPRLLWVLDAVLVGGTFVWYTISQNLVTYVIKRVAEAFVVLLVIASLTFLLLRVIPGGPFDQEKSLPPEVKANIEAKYNLNAPLFTQYTDYILGIFKGDLGESYKYLGRNVSEIITETLPVSFQLGIYALIISFLIGIPLGIFAASKHNTLWDNASMFMAVSGVSLPSFLVAPILIIIFCFQLDLLPPAFWDGPEYYILPSFILGIRPAAVIARLTRASVLEVIRSDYIRTAKAKGLPQRVVLYRHVLKNSLIPVLTFSGPLVAGILSGSFIIELIFAVPGMGKHLIQSVTNRDYPLILGLTLLFSALLVFANLIVDLLYSYFDPRIKLS